MAKNYIFYCLIIISITGFILIINDMHHLLLLYQQIYKYVNFLERATLIDGKYIYYV